MVFIPSLKDCTGGTSSLLLGPCGGVAERTRSRSSEYSFSSKFGDSLDRSAFNFT